MMLEQSIHASDLLSVIMLAFLELALSADNAIVLSLLSRKLPEALRKKALLVGVISAFILRGLALLLVAFLLEFIWIQLIGAGYLVFLSVRHFIHKQNPTSAPEVHSFWHVVCLIELFDLLFAIDSIVAGVAFINSSLDKLWIVYIGGMIGLVAMRFAAGFFNSLLDRFPRLETSAYLMVGWIGLKLGFSAFHHPIPPLLFWILLGVIFLLGFLKGKK